MQGLDGWPAESPQTKHESPLLLTQHGPPAELCQMWAGSLPCLAADQEAAVAKQGCRAERQPADESGEAADAWESWADADPGMCWRL